MGFKTRKKVRPLPPESFCRKRGSLHGMPLYAVYPVRKEFCENLKSLSVDFFWEQDVELDDGFDIVITTRPEYFPDVPPESC